MSAIRCFDIGGSKVVAADVSMEAMAVAPSKPLEDTTEVVSSDGVSDTVSDTVSETAVGPSANASAGASTVTPKSVTVDVVSRAPTPGGNFKQFCQLLASLCPAGNAAVSISIAGVIHPQNGLVKSANIPCISGRNLARDLRHRLDRPVFVINDANAFALAESRARDGDGGNYEVVLAVILGTGIGGGVVIDGQVLTGADGTAGEWGHGPASAVRTGYPLPQLKCNCGQTNCVDTLGGARGLETLYHHVTAIKKDSHAILNAWQQREPCALKVVDIWLDVVGGALAGVVNLLAPATVAVGGGLANCTALIDALDHEVSQRRLASDQSRLLYCVNHGPEQGLTGAAIYAQQFSAC